MASVFRKLRDYTNALWDSESPVIIEKMRLSRDTLRGVNILTITFRNVSDHYILGLSIAVTMKDQYGKQIQDSFDYHYYGLEVSKNKVFGSDVNIIVEPEAENFLITIMRVDFEDSLFYRTPVTLQKMPDPSATQALGDMEKPFLEIMAARYPKLKIPFAPEEKKLYWRCVCGRIYPNHYSKCPSCRISREQIFSVFKEIREEEKQRRKEEEERLRLEEEERKKRLEEEERLRLEEEEKQRLEAEKRRRKKRKMLYAFLGFAAVACVAILLTTLIPEKVPVADEETMQADTDPGETMETPVETPAADTPLTEEAEAFEEVPKFTTPLAVIGSDLDEEDQRIVLRLIGMKEEDFEKFHVMYITSEKEHEVLDKQFGSAFIGNHALSCLLITPAKPGSGLTISTYNITYCTEEMYREALISSGITDAEVVAAGPFKTSGTSALTGALLAGEYLGLTGDSAVETSP